VQNVKPVTNKRSLRVAILAGEASGDILGAGLIEALKKRYSDIEFYGIGGPLMIEQGCYSKVPMDQLSVMGIVEVLSRLPKLLSLQKSLISELLQDPPDIFIGIDAPDFNLKIELALKDAGILTVHYVSPSVWAWKAKRIYKIKKAVDLLLSLFPFEARYYEKTKQKVTYVGHPLAEIISSEYDIAACKQEFGFKPEDQVVALLPGSRSSEIKYLLPVFLQTAEMLLKKHPHIQFLLPAVNQQRLDEINVLLAHSPQLPVTLVLQRSRSVMRAADAILIASGTATLEAALLGKPMVVAYKMAALTYAIYSRMINTKYVSLPNILANEMLVPELLQDQATPEKLSIALEQALTNKSRRLYLQSKFKEIHRQLNMSANERAADAIQTLLSSSPLEDS
jgi:lipid-A-disaccharide synthase